MYVFNSLDWVVVFTDAGKKRGRLGHERNFWDITIVLPHAIASCGKVAGTPNKNYAEALLQCYFKNREAAQQERLQ